MESKLFKPNETVNYTVTKKRGKGFGISVKTGNFEKYASNGNIIIRSKNGILIAKKPCSVTRITEQNALTKAIMKDVPNE